MEKQTTKLSQWTVELEGMPRFDMSMKRINAWFENEIIDRAPIRFQAHNAFLASATEEVAAMSPEDKKAWWFDAETQLDLFLKPIEGRRIHGETFPVYFPNLGPNVYAAFYGAELVFGDITSWAIPCIHTWDDVENLQFDWSNVYFRKLEELTQYALERCKGKALVGYTDMHPGLDCVAAWRDTQQLCIDMIEAPEQVEHLATMAIDDFEMIYDHFDTMLKEAGQLSVSWMGIPSYGRMHIPSCDFSTLISPRFFQRFGLPILKTEVQTTTHNVFHVDGRGVAKHLDTILSVPEVHAIQWVQGVGDDYPIMQWVPFIKELQAKNIPVIVDLSKDDLEDFIKVTSPKGLFLWIATDSEEDEIAIIKLVEKWK